MTTMTDLLDLDATPDEVKALELSAELAGVLRRVVEAGGDADQIEHDWRELSALIHLIQRYVIANPVARAAPSLRALGEGPPRMSD